MAEGGGASDGYRGSEAPASSGGIKGQMNVLNQVLHSDCKPVLEFNLVRVCVCVCVCEHISCCIVFHAHTIRCGHSTV